MVRTPDDRRRALLKRHRGILAAGALVQAALGWVATQTYLVENNNLAANGNWVVSKTELDRGLMGAYSFLSGRQSLAGGGLHLDAWHGFQEVVTAEPIEGVRSIEFDCVIARGAWLVVSFNRGGNEPYAAVRLSRHPSHPSAFLRIDEDGFFHAREPLPLGLEVEDGPYRVRLDLEPERVVVRVGGVVAGRWAVAPNAAQRVGFRGGLRAVAVDNVEIAAAGGGLRESFSGPAGRHVMAAAVSLTLILLNLALFQLLSRFVADSGRRLSFAFLTANLTLLICAAIVFAYVRVRVSWYPGQQRVLAQSEVFYRKGEQDRVVAQLLDRLEAFEGPRGRRILFVGSSQTWGAGARRDEDAFVSQLEARLNEPFLEPRVLCLNLGVSSAKARHLLPLVKDVFPRVRPRLVVINLSSNDRSSRDFGRPMRKIIRRAQAAGARPVLVLEANAPGAVDRGLQARHLELRALAAELDLPLIDLHGHLLPLVDTGFLWWDKVHLTTWGQRLAAEKLYHEIAPLLGDDSRLRARKKPVSEETG